MIEDIKDKLLSDEKVAKLENDINIDIYIMIDENTTSFWLGESVTTTLDKILLKGVSRKMDIGRSDIEIIINNYYQALAEALKINITPKIRYGNIFYSGRYYPPSILVSRTEQQIDLSTCEIAEDFYLSTIGLLLNPKCHLTIKGIKAKVSNFSNSKTELYKILDIYALKFTDIVHSGSGSFIRDGIERKNNDFDDYE